MIQYFLSGFLLSKDTKNLASSLDNAQSSSWMALEINLTVSCQVSVENQ